MYDICFAPLFLAMMKKKKTLNKKKKGYTLIM
jgi:hypothetical protein